MDAHANIARLATSEGIRRVMDRAAAIGVTDVVIDVKPVDGTVTYRSRFAPQLLEWRGAKRDSAFPYVETMIREARARGMKAHLSLNIFAEGHKVFKKGRAYDDSTYRSWAVTVYSRNGLKSIFDTEEEIAIFVNPSLSAVRTQELGLLEEAARMFHPDGIVLDRCRFTGFRTDFSDSSRAAFERWLGRRVEHWPYEILTLTVLADGTTDYQRGPLFTRWVEWRASVIATFIREARSRVKRVDPRIQFSDYVGAWYPTYFEVGVNWASRGYDASRDYSWATPAYSATGYAEDLDLLMTGTYFYEVDIAELHSDTVRSAGRTEPDMKRNKEDWYSVEGSALLAMKVTKGVVPLYASLYVDQYKSRKNEEQFVRAVRTCLRLTGGVMIFDLVHLDTDGWWDVLARALKDAP